MNEEQAKIVAEGLGGETWMSGGGIWLVLIRRKDGAIVALTDEVVCEYRDEEAFDNSQSSISILLHG